MHDTEPAPTIKECWLTLGHQRLDDLSENWKSLDACPVISGQRRPVPRSLDSDHKTVRPPTGLKGLAAWRVVYSNSSSSSVHRSRTLHRSSSTSKGLTGGTETMGITGVPSFPVRCCSSINPSGSTMTLQENCPLHVWEEPPCNSEAVWRV